MKNETSICCDSPITEMGFCLDCKEPTGSYQEVEADESEIEEMRVNQLLARYSAYVAIACTASFILGGVSVWVW